MGKFSLNDILNNASLAEAGAVRKADEKREVIVELEEYSKNNCHISIKSWNVLTNYEIIRSKKAHSKSEI